MSTAATSTPVGSAGADPAPAVISPRKLAHIVLRTRAKLSEMVPWYCLVLGAHVVFDGGRLVFLAYDDEHHRIAIAQSEDLADRPHRSAGLDHIAFTYDDIGQLLSTYDRLKQAGVLPFCGVNHGPTTSLYYQDPDGNRIELQVDNFEDMDAATALMQAHFSVNPLGDEIDPDELLARHRAGASAADLTRPAETPTPPSMALVGRILSS